MDRSTPKIALAEQVLGQPLEDWLRPRRENGMSWGRLARELTHATEGKANVSYELLRRHFGHISRDPAKVPVPEPEAQAS